MHAVTVCKMQHALQMCVRACMRVRVSASERVWVCVRVRIDKPTILVYTKIVFHLQV